VTWVRFDFNEISGTQAMRGKEDLAKLQLASLMAHVRGIPILMCNVIFVYKNLLVS
jgi:hypothetical protein